MASDLKLGDDVAYVLARGLMSDQDGVGRVYHDQILDPYGSNQSVL
jgi:hypothetical protein